MLLQYQEQNGEHFNDMANLSTSSARKVLLGFRTITLNPPWGIRGHSGYGRGQWEKPLHTNASCHSLSPYPEYPESMGPSHRGYCHRNPISMKTSSKGNIFRVTGHLCVEFTCYRWIRLTKASDAELWCFLWSAPWINGWVNNREAGDLRCHRPHYDVIVRHQPVPTPLWLSVRISDHSPINRQPVCI